MSSDDQDGEERSLRESADALLDENRYDEARAAYRRLAWRGDISAQTTNNLVVAEEADRLAVARHAEETLGTAAAKLYRVATLHALRKFDACVALCTATLESGGLDRLDEMRLRIWRLKAHAEAARPDLPRLEEDIAWMWQRGDNAVETRTLRLTVVAALERLGGAMLPIIEHLTQSAAVDESLRPLIEAKRAALQAASNLRASLRDEET